MTKQAPALHYAEILENFYLGIGRMDATGAAAELRRLHQFEVSHAEWSEKTEWVQDTVQPKELGRHRADVIKQRFDHLDAINAELVAALQGMVNIASDSRGVAGYHRNGEVADWDEFQEWQTACAAIAKATGAA